MTQEYVSISAIRKHKKEIVQEEGTVFSKLHIRSIFILSKL